MEPKRPRKLELLASRIEPRLWQYELILLALMAASIVLYYFLPSWAGAGALLLGGGLIWLSFIFFRWFLPRPVGQEWNSGIHKLHSAALAFGVLGGYSGCFICKVICFFSPYHWLFRYWPR